jgi:ATP-dependent DNA ligase
VQETSLASESLEGGFGKIDLPILPPYPPMEAKSSDTIPAEGNYVYEPKWDGFRCLAFRSHDQILLQSKAGQPLGRYFPELVQALKSLPAERFVLDGEIVIFLEKESGQSKNAERLSFDDLLQRIHPAESRIRKLSESTPATFMCFDLLVDEHGKSLVDLPLTERRRKLEDFFSLISGKSTSWNSATQLATIRLSPASDEIGQAREWMHKLAAMGLDGVVAKLANEPYRSGQRTAMIKVKRLRTADCVVGGFRYAEKGDRVGSLLLGLYDERGLLDHVGFTSSFDARQREELKQIVESLIGPPGFTGRAPGGPSRWSTNRSGEWEPLTGTLVCEVRYDHFSGGRFRHGTKFLRWRPEKRPKQCTFEQLLRVGEGNGG